MELWTSRSNSGKQMLLSAACALVGLILMFGFRDFRAFGTNAMAGFLLGLLLLLIGVGAFLVSGRQTVVIDPKARSITVEDSNRLRAKKRLIPFSDVVGVGIGYLGKRSTGVTWYYLVLRLKSGEEYSLFAPGRFFEGGRDRAIVEGWKQRLEQYLAQ
jgi:hypothetical protein